MIVRKTLKKYYDIFVSFNHEKIIKHIASENNDTISSICEKSNIV